jgi:hypothetical protein
MVDCVCLNWVAEVKSTIGRAKCDYIHTSVCGRVDALVCLSFTCCLRLHNLYNWNRHCGNCLSFGNLGTYLPVTSLPDIFLLDNTQHQSVGLQFNNLQEEGTVSSLLCTELATSEPLVGSIHCSHISPSPLMMVHTSSTYPTLPCVHSRSLWTSLAA